jgi:hypothetical protein
MLPKLLKAMGKIGDLPLALRLHPQNGSTGHCDSWQAHTILINNHTALKSDGSHEKCDSLRPIKFFLKNSFTATKRPLLNTDDLTRF